MDADVRAALLACLTQPPTILAESGNRIVARPIGLDPSNTSSGAPSWDRYFHDLATGGFVTWVEGERRIARSRAWHFALKNMALADLLLCQGRQVRVVDIGCSAGYFRRFIEGNLPSKSEMPPIHYVGLDVREEQLHEALRAGAPAKGSWNTDITPSLFIQADATDLLPLRDEHFEAAVCFEMLKYLDVESGTSLLLEIRRILKRGGLLALSMPTSYEFAREHRAQTMARFDPNELIHQLNSAGFEVQEVRGSQANYADIDNGLDSTHRETFDSLSGVLPKEIVAAVFAPLSPKFCTQLTYYCERR